MQALESSGEDRFHLSVAPAREASELARGRRFLCANCGHAVTDQDARIVVNGTTEHDVVNPAGAGFHIGCFMTVVGCSTAGEPTTAFTWFPGFAWRLLYCGHCATHLGWRFDAGASDSFFALVLQRLIAEV